MFLEVLAFCEEQQACLDRSYSLRGGMYKKCVTETLAKAVFGIDKDKVKLLSFHDFRDKLSGQGLGYNPTNTFTLVIQ